MIKIQQEYKSHRVLRIVAWCMGRIFDLHFGKIKKAEVVAIVDETKSHEIDDYKGIPVISGDRLGEFSFDTVVVFSDESYDEISLKLSAYGVSEEAVFSWRFFVYYKAFRKDWTCMKSLAHMETFAERQGFSILLDSRNRLIDYGIRNLSGGSLRLRYLSGKKMPFPIYENLYEKDTSEAEAELFLDPFVYMDSNEFAKHISENPRYDTVLFNWPMEHSPYWKKWHEEDFEGLGELKTQPYPFGRLCRLDRGYATVYVAMHKETHLPTQESIYKKIAVGEGLRDKEGFIQDNTGDNISNLNKYINECTAMYWIWKNDRTSRYAGLCHYRRFLGEGRPYSGAELLSMLRHNDIIINKTLVYPGLTVYEEMERVVSKEAFDEASDIICRLISGRQPEYVDAFEAVMRSTSFNPCNMFIAPKPIFDRYCEWLFSFIIDACKEFSIDRYDEYSCRQIGFFAERMLTVWLMKQKYRVKEAPVFMTEG